MMLKVEFTQEEISELIKKEVVRVFDDQMNGEGDFDNLEVTFSVGYKGPPTPNSENNTPIVTGVASFKVTPNEE